MKTIWQNLTKVSLLVVLAAAAVVALPGCKKHEDVGNKLNRAADNVGDAAREAGKEIDKSL